MISPFARRNGHGDPEVAAGDPTVPAHLLRRQEPEFDNRAAEAGLAALQNLPAPAPRAPDPLHPDVAKLMSAGSIAAAKSVALEAQKSADLMLTEAQQWKEATDTWAAGLIAEAENHARKLATIHLKQRTTRAKMSAAQAEYESDELPPVEEEKGASDVEAQ
jgi:hypothetical protein